MEDLRIDSHKLIFHPRRTAEWLSGSFTYPINAEIGLHGSCNHRCTFCGMDFLGYKNHVLNKEILLRNLREMYKKGLKSEINLKNFYDNIDEVSRELEAYADDSFSVYVRLNRMNKYKIKRSYNACHAMPFHIFIDTSGGVWPCCVLLGFRELCFGNINEDSFTKIWEGSARARAISLLGAEKLARCSPYCHLDEMNRYLEELKNPGLHVNFI
ncbi:MAG: SPASM domain-containing protein [Syntrophomonadaceae bacterium]|jgi:sulfatase maturation enzyme AslB (radical SAM superfamily)|nr:SPASM domain-containing protein [Syntrophomonadaceae bacterium]